MEINWNRDIDAALRQASETGRPVLLDFTAAPM
jgi:thiol:disulfide interchange protein